VIKEDYVSFETAKVLKEKGFENEGVSENGGFYCDYKYDGTDIGIVYESEMLNKDLARNEYLRPTYQMTLKWLREVHHIEISITYGFPFINGKPSYKYFWCPVKVTDTGLEYPMDGPFVAFAKEMADTYEEAVEAAIRYSLENLI